MGLVSVVGCAHASSPSDRVWLQDGRVVPQNPAESAALAKLSTLEPTSAHTLSDQVTVGPAYSAASGRLCRTVQSGAASQRSVRLACESEQGWIFVPDVFVSLGPEAKQ
jgi:hypothetical protein